MQYFYTISILVSTVSTQSMVSMGSKVSIETSGADVFLTMKTAGGTLLSCRRRWRRMSPTCVNLCSQMSHWYGRSPVCTLRCVLRKNVRENIFPQIGHLWRRIPVCLAWCWIRLAFDLKNINWLNLTSFWIFGCEED